MRKPVVFVSSTCHDLKGLRESIGTFLDGAGYEPRLSEQHTFPVHPDLDTVANCLEAVTAAADIFILILGTRYGSVGADGKSVTNLEFLAAKTKGIPIYTFVLTSVLNTLPMWRDNPSANFKSQVDSVKIFEFIAGIRDSGERWVYSFETATQIVDVLRTQLGYLFSEALDTRRRARGITEFPRSPPFLPDGNLAFCWPNLGIGGNFCLPVPSVGNSRGLMICAGIGDTLLALKSEGRSPIASSPTLSARR